MKTVQQRSLLQTIDFHCFVHCVSSDTRKHATPWILHRLLRSTHRLFKFLQPLWYDSQNLSVSVCMAASQGRRHTEVCVKTSSHTGRQTLRQTSHTSRHTSRQAWTSPCRWPSQQTLVGQPQTLVGQPQTQQVFNTLCKHLSTYLQHIYKLIMYSIGHFRHTIAD